MESREEILKELLGIAPRLAMLDKTNVYHVPADYFATFKTVMLEKVKLADAKKELKTLAPVLSKLSKPQETAPADYFSSFSSGLLNKIRNNEVSAELAEIAPMLGSLQKVNIYQAPANYFSTLPAQMAKVVAAEKKEPAITLPPVLTAINNVLEQIVGVVFKAKYNFAFAGLATTIVLAVMMMNEVQQCADLECKLAEVSSAELDAYFDTHADEFQRSVLDVSTDDKKLMKRSDAGELNFDDYVSSDISDDMLNDALLD